MDNIGGLSWICWAPLAAVRSRRVFGVTRVEVTGKDAGPMEQRFNLVSGAPSIDGVVMAYAQQTVGG